MSREHLYHMNMNVMTCAKKEVIYCLIGKCNYNLNIIFQLAVMQPQNVYVPVYATKVQAV